MLHFPYMAMEGELARWKIHLGVRCTVDLVAWTVSCYIYRIMYRTAFARPVHQHRCMISAISMLTLHPAGTAHDGSVPR